MARARSQRDLDRLQLGDAALLSARRAAELAGAIGGTDEERLAMLREADLVLTVNGHEVCVWGDVIAWVRQQDEQLKPAPKPRRQPGRRLPAPHRL